MNLIFEVVYRIYEKSDISQREFSKLYDISLGKTNKLFSEAVEMGFIEKSIKYAVTEKGMNLLEENKVDNAVIMAAGFGSRFVPMTYDTPKGLLNVRGEILIERQIRQLHEAGIEEIIIVVGYLKEKFEYLRDKYNVKLVYNPDYSIKNNISSIYHAAKYMKNTYLLTSDIYMPNNLYRKYEAYSNYAVEFYKKETEEWKVDFNKDGLITKVYPEGGENCWAINGPSFFKQEFSSKLVEEISKTYDKKLSAQWYWEDVYMRNLDIFDLYVRKYPNGSIVEFECLEELRLFDESYLIKSRSEILDIISSVFNVSLKDIVNIQILKEGMTNDSFLFEVNNTKYVFRNPGVGTEKLIKRQEEADVYEAIKDLNISDNVIYLEPSRGYKITEFITDSRHMDRHNPVEYNKALDILRALHSNGIAVDHSFDYAERINFYYKLCVSNDAILFNDFDEVFATVRKLLDKLDEKNYEKVLCHVDFITINFLCKNDEMTLLDWEYSGMADPFTDLAMFVVFDGLNDKEVSALLTDYLQREPSEEEVWRLNTYIALSGFLWALWTQYKQALGSDFGTYGMEQYDYGRKYSRIALKGIVDEK